MNLRVREPDPAIRSMDRPAGAGPEKIDARMRVTGALDQGPCRRRPARIARIRQTPGRITLAPTASRSASALSRRCARVSDDQPER